VGELVGKVLAEEHTDMPRPAVAWLAQQLMQVGGSPSEPTLAMASATRIGLRAATATGSEAGDARVGSIELAIPRLRSGSRFCHGLYEQVPAFRERPLDGAYSYLWLDAERAGAG
jgi:hypothetical protein